MVRRKFKTNRDNRATRLVVAAGTIVLLATAVVLLATLATRSPLQQAFEDGISSDRPPSSSWADEADVLEPAGRDPRAGHVTPAGEAAEDSGTRGHSKEQEAVAQQDSGHPEEEPADRRQQQQQQEQEEDDEEGDDELGDGFAALPATRPKAAKKIGTYTKTLADGKQVEEDLLDEPIPSDCYAEPHADYAGPALTWGLTYKLPSAAQCCQACKDFKPTAEGKRCNVWVFCPDSSGECWAPDIWNHTSGECWLKWQADYDNNIDRSATNLAVNRRGEHPPDFRKEHETAPLMVPWISGVIPQR